MTVTRTLKTLVLMSAAVAGLSACDMLSGREGPGQYATDTAISARVKMALTQDPLIASKPFQINVETLQSVVLLSGFVDSVEMEQKAVAIARKVDGVKGVKDSMHPPSGYQKR